MLPPLGVQQISEESEFREEPWQILQGWKLFFINHSILLIKEKVQGWINWFMRIYVGN